MYEKLMAEYKTTINQLNEDNKELIDENKSLSKDLSSTKEKLIEISTNYDNLEQLYNSVQEENKSGKNKKEIKIVDNFEIDELNLNTMVRNEVSKMMKENYNFKSQTYSIENFTLNYVEQKKHKPNNSKELKLLSDNVDEILQNIQKKREKLIQSQKLMKELNGEQNN